MSFLDALFGKRTPAKPKPDGLFALTTAQITLEADLGLKAAGRAGVAFRAVDSSLFEALQRDLEQFIAVGARETQTAHRVEKDPYGFTWVVLEDPSTEDLVATIHSLSITLHDQGFGGQLLAAAFRFNNEAGHPVYWIYNYKRGAFYPFIPIGARRRDNARELRLKAQIGTELPLEPQLDQWYALWDLPV